MYKWPIKVEGVKLGITTINKFYVKSDMSRRTTTPDNAANLSGLTSGDYVTREHLLADSEKDRGNVCRYVCATTSLGFRL